MSIKTTLNYSPNFNRNKRNIKQVKFIIIHYTGMKKETAALNRLTSIQSEVSSHYLIKNSGKIVTIVPDLYVAWHAGKSSWKNIKYLNKYSIGIEISNPGHKHGYKNFSKKQIDSLVKLSKFLIKKYRIKKNNILGHSDISPERKMDPGEKFPWEKLSKKNISLWPFINKKILINLRNKNCNKFKENKFLNNLFKIGYSEYLDKKINKNKYHLFAIKAFQRRFRPELINGKIDLECLIISEKLNKLKF
jgi:N-acetylmuramoyl-L-alanine amidase